MANQLTPQEKLFLDRIALAIIEKSPAVVDDAAIDAAASAVAADDVWLMNQLLTKVRDAASAALSDRIWTSIRLAAA